MNVPLLNDSVTALQAQEALLSYRQHRGNYDKYDWEIERVYERIAKGQIVISVMAAIQHAGLDALGRPKLAIARADAPSVWCDKYQHRNSPCIAFGDSRPGMRWSITVPMVTAFKEWRLEARTPRIPPQYRPSEKQLKNYWILFEADWVSIPKDPYLLRKIGEDAWVVVAAWDLTPVELSVLRAHEVRT